MPVHKLTPILNVSNIGQSFAWFEALGWKRGFSYNQGGFIGSGAHALAENVCGPATFGSICSGEVEIFLCCGAQGSRGTIVPKFPGDDQTDGVWMFWWMGSVAEVDALHTLAIQGGMLVTHPPTNEPWGVREFHLRHPDGHMFRISAGLESADGPG